MDLVIKLHLPKVRYPAIVMKPFEYFYRTFFGVF